MCRVLLCFVLLWFYDELITYIFIIMYTVRPIEYVQGFVVLCFVMVLCCVNYTTLSSCTVCPIEYEHGFVVLCCVVVLW